MTIQNAVQMGSATGAVLIASNTILNGATFYSGGPINFGNVTHNIAGPLVVTNAATLGTALQAVTISSNLVVSGGIVANGTLGTAGQILSSQGGASPQWIVAPISGTTLLGQNNEWTQPQTYTSSITIQNAVAMGSVTGAVLVASNTILNGATFYSGGPINFGNVTHNVSGPLVVSNTANLGAALAAVPISSNLVV